MDTLRVVKLIRESEALAGAGRHDDACRVLEDMLAGPGLSESHRAIVVKKKDLYTRRQERVSRRQPGPEEDTLMDLKPDPAERPTNKLPEPVSRGIPTEVVPRPRSGETDTEVPPPMAARRMGPNNTEYLPTHEPEARAPSSKSSLELRRLADSLPDHDLRRQLALEVVQLREELERASNRSTGVKSDSGRYRIPAADANTIVRSAAGDSDIEVHLPGRDEDAADLMVLRRDSLQRAALPIAQGGDADGFGPERVPAPNVFRPLAKVLGIAVVVALAGWVVYVGYRAITAEAEAYRIGPRGVGALRLGSAPPSGMPLEHEGSALRHAASGMLVHLDGAGRVGAISIPGPAHAAPGAAERFSAFELEAGGTDWSIDSLRVALGESQPANLASREGGVWRFMLGDGVVLEAQYRSGSPEQPEWIRLINTEAELTLPTLHDGHEPAASEDA
jgi:hypothetical protein